MGGWMPSLGAAESPIEGLECRMEKIGGVPTFVLNGQPHSGMCYSSYDCSEANLGRRVRQFAEAGCDLFNFVVEISGYGYSRPMWAARDRWDFSELDDRVHRILEPVPQAMFLPRLYIDAPAWWRAENPAEMMLLDNGSPSFGEKLFALPREGDYPSLASRKWREDMKYALETVLDHIAHSDYRDRVIGYQLSGQKTEEWYHWSMNCDHLGDYSLHAQQAFREWLRARYGTDEALQSAWSRPDATLDSAEIPSREERYGDRSRTFRDPRRERNVIDFHTFWSDLMADSIAYFARVVKDKTQGRKVVGAFYAYTFEFTDLAEDAGHLALGRLLRCPDVDFIMAPSSYYDRNLPGKPYFRAPVASCNLHGKMFWDDFDQVSYKWYEKLQANPDLKTWEYQMGLTQTPEEFVWMNRREVGMALAQGAQLAHFDIHGGYYEDPIIMAGVKQLGEIRRAALQLDDRTSHPEILLLVDEESQHYLTFRNPLLTPLLSGQIAQMGFVAPYDAALLSDLELLETTPYKLVLVLNAFHLDAGQRQAIQRKLQNGGKTVIWYYAPGYFHEAGRDPSSMRDLTGLNIVPEDRFLEGGTALFTPPNGGEPQPLELLQGESFCVDDPQAIVLAIRSDGSGKVVMAEKRFPEWTSLYTAAAPLPAPVLRWIAAAAGVHLYHQRPTDLLFASRSFLTLAADLQGGERQIHLPHPATVTDLTNGAILCEQADQFITLLQPKEVRIFSLQ